MSTERFPSAADAARRAQDFIRAHARPGPTALCPRLYLYQVDAVCELWQAGERDLGEIGLEIPFWAAAWPGGQALARFLMEAPGMVRGARVLDLGTGSGICAIAAAFAGADRVQAVDPDPVAAQAVLLNARLNGVAVQARAVDLLDTAPPPDVDIILAADLWYDSGMAQRVTAWLRAAAGSGTRVLAADLGRAYLPPDGMLEIARYDVPTSLDLERERVTTTRVYRLHGG